MSEETIRVRVKNGEKGFIYGKYRRGDIEGKDPDEFILKPVEYSVEVDDKGDPKIKSAEDQFSSKWMIRLDGEPAAASNEEKHPSEMGVKELKAALKVADVKVPANTNKAGMIELLVNHLENPGEGSSDASDDLDAE